MTLPDKDKLYAIWKTHATGLPTSGRFWSSTEYNKTNAHYVDFLNGFTNTLLKYDGYGALCLGN